MISGGLELFRIIFTPTFNIKEYMLWSWAILPLVIYAHTS
jgi:hypothetical protein